MTSAAASSNGSLFPRQSRLLASRDFQAVFKRCARSRDEYFMVCARYSRAHNPRIGLAISKKHARRAVDRNRIKRVAREFFRTHRDLQAAADYVVVNHAAATTASNAALTNSLMRHFQQLATKNRRPSRPDSA